MTSEPLLPSGASGDPASLPPLFTTPSPRPGRVRGTFSLRGDEPPAPVPLEQVRRRHAVGRPSPSVDRLAEQQGIDWGLVAAFRTLVANRLASAMGEGWRDRADSDPDRVEAGRIPMDRSAQEQFGWSVIEDLLRDHTADTVKTGSGEAWTPQQRALMAQAIFDAVFRLGRLQPLVDDDRVENIFILGCRQVLLELTDGSRIKDHRWPTATRS